MFQTSPLKLICSLVLTSRMIDVRITPEFTYIVQYRLLTRRIFLSFHGNMQCRWKYKRYPPESGAVKFNFAKDIANWRSSGNTERWYGRYPVEEWGLCPSLLTLPTRRLFTSFSIKINCDYGTTALGLLWETFRNLDFICLPAGGNRGGSTLNYPMNLEFF